MKVEDRLEATLREHAQRRHVDVDALYASTLDRLGDRGAAVSGRHVRPGVLAAAAIVAVAGIAGGGLWLEQELGGPGGFATGPDVEHVPAERAHVDDTFTCAHTVLLTDFMGREIFGDGPDLGVGAYGAERFQLIPGGDTAVMQVGMADGTLTARVQLRRSGGAWVIDTVRRCTGPDGSDVPVAERFELGAHGRLVPDPPAAVYDDSFGSSSPDGSVVALDDRAFYNRVGVVERFTRYAYEADGGIVVAEFQDGQPSGSTSWSNEPPSDSFGVDFIPTYGLSEPERTFDGWTFYSTEPATLTARLDDGRVIEAQQFRGDDWNGTLHLILARGDRIEVVVLERDGERRTFKPSSFG